MRTALSCAPILLLCACATPHQDIAAGTASALASSTSVVDTAQVYNSAIAEYIKAAVKNGEPLPDTLYIGRRPDFPVIELPAVIERTNIRLLTQDQAETVKEGDGFVYLNVMGWLSAGTAEFLVVTFKHGFQPQHNCHLYFSQATGSAALALDSLKFEHPYLQGE